ncbi:cardiolipin synthase [Pediococcus pentosaceus]|uniref:Cardiolipin synthase n=2 Tax=Pediococcus pentosaceus TaxID=1255 RepID=A0A379BSQ6_PEDPE|nr:MULTISPECIES: cardiolipin synthase [Pediococcus]ABJ68324.1 cardiolipin synthetase 2 [Pediococcus pentosaceus ATCC 25745]ANI97656.1 cardiolipin synthase [Pediococcus pentosaceus]ASC08165.1 Major cardiolipin synthase ClsA [Pediococcus pentosaceus]AVL01759.1 cardiolipin synthase [Pediococcus pentosaceus]AXR43762.1 cardiolipin synthase [Pediococcus pentosaceus]
MVLIEIVFYLINIIIALTIALMEKRDISAAWAWLFVMLLLPGIGFIIYLFFGWKLNQRQIFDLKAQKRLGISDMAEYQKRNPKNKPTLDTNLENDLVQMFLNTDNAILTTKNDLKIFTDGHEKFNSLFEDLKKAKHHINIEYFTIYDDQLGKKLRKILVQKAREGVQVRVLYDLFGSKGSKQKFFKELIQAGGEVTPFMKSKLGYYSFRINFRNHRKIVVIDGSVGYIGGFNIGDQYLGRNKRFGNWRDTHLRLEGSVVLQLQSRFFMDWNASAKRQKVQFSLDYFPQSNVQNNIPMQIVSSGPENDVQKIKQGYIKMIMGAKHSIWIETPYFIPDDALMEALLIAIRSGIEVRIVIPQMPDHPFVYRATEYYVQQLLKAGARIYSYQNGFMHAKTIVVDNMITSVGSANWDIRSFKLNFEANAFMYDPKVAEQIIATIKNDLKDARELDEEYFKQQSSWKKFRQLASRLISPIL